MIQGKYILFFFVITKWQHQLIFYLFAFSIRIDFDAEGCLHEFITQPEGQQDTAFNVMDDIIRRVRDEHEAGLEERRKNKRRKINDTTNDEGLQEMVV